MPSVVVFIACHKSVLCKDFTLVKEQDYRKFYRNFGKYLKFGCSQEDNPNQKRLANLLRFYSSKHQDEMISLKQYVADMKPGQKAIYYFSSESVKSARNAPFLEQLYNKDLEVIIVFCYFLFS